MSIELVSMGQLVIPIGENIRLAGTPAGDRLIVEFPAIEWRGDRLRDGTASSTFASRSRLTTARSSTCR